MQANTESLASAVNKMKTSTLERVMNHISQKSGTTSIGLISCDLRLSSKTVRRHVASLVDAGRVVFGWDGQSLEVTEAEKKERAIDARVRTHR